MSQAPVVVDIWGGEGSCDHLARFIRSTDEALHIARHELAKGYLINLRADAEWGPDHDFDLRPVPQ
ncbi:hypothetical protein [Mesorhizobium sp. B2-4-7]|uniref:hypothetical protein n=1 Tax=Mesorhizobium sp. B2-4-7 TaxID=2589942 RepID=UPI001127FC70|nr:hypothetical protein [Mesorhizobium sp. B2-4-7]TPL30200.1 hypothetical protein FJ946_02725 [Mesorhizobium sp. B2-4-7]